MEAQNALVVACHFPELGFGHLVREEGWRYRQGIYVLTQNYRCEKKISQRDAESKETHGTRRSKDLPDPAILKSSYVRSGELV